MGVGIKFSKGCSHDYSPPTKGNPNPFKFKVKRCEVSNRDKYVLVELNYPDCTNFMGNKILVLQCSYAQFAKLQSIDPHFIEEGSTTNVVARFRPNESGWKNGINFLKMLDK